MIFVENAEPIMLSYLCVIVTVGIVFGLALKIWQLFGKPNK